MTIQKVDLNNLDDQDLTEEFLHEQHSVDPEIPENDGPGQNHSYYPKA